MIKGKKILLVILSALVIVSAGLFYVDATQSKGRVSKVTSDEGEIRQAPDFMLSTLDNQNLVLSKLKGKVVLLNFWATWCPPCIDEIPDLIELQKEYGDEKLVIIGVVIADDISNVRNFAKEKNINYPIGIGAPEMVESYGKIQSIPTTFVISKKGEIISEVLGKRDKSFFKKEIEEALAL